jgi:hypothetical protein
MALNLDQANGGSFAFTAAGVGRGSTATQLKTTNTTPYCVDGIFSASKAAVASFALAVPPVTRTDPVTGASTNVYSYSTIPAGYKAAFSIWLNAAGTPYVTQGPVTPAGSNADKVPAGPYPGAGYCLIGVATLYNATVTANGGWRPGTDAFNLAGTTETYFDVFGQAAQSF